MLQEAIYKFKASGPMLLPDLIDNYWIGETKAYEDYAILPYEVHIPQPIDKVLDMFEMNADLAILYHLEPTIETVFGHEFCPRHIRQREVVSFRDADRNDCHILCIGYRHPRCCLPYLLQVLTLNNNRYGNSKSEIPPVNSRRPSGQHNHHCN